MENIFNINEKILDIASLIEKKCENQFKIIDQNSYYNGQKVLKAFIDNKVSEADFYGSTGYGYGDRGRETLDKVFAQVFGCEDSLVRHNFVSGTHALTTALFGVLRTGDTMVCLTGKPYDTMEQVIGISGDGMGSLKDYGINYEQVELLENGEVDIESCKKQVENVKLAYIQRSRGYTLRPSLTVEQIKNIISQIKTVNSDIIVMIDNCYGEFVEKFEPTQVGADLVVGSLIKNAGGGLAQTGGYIAGKKDLVELCSFRLTSPGMGKEVGCTLNQTKHMMMGLFMAPDIVSNALKTSTFALSFFDYLGYDVYPKFDEYKTDIIGAISIGSEQGLIAFCQGIQKGSPVDSFVAPEPWDMPGYDSKIIMAAGAFNMGASIELSADAPLKSPYATWLQGGLTYTSGKTGILLAAQSMFEQGLLNI